MLNLAKAYQITFILHIQGVFSLPGRGFHQRVTLISSVPMTLDDVIVHVRQFIIALVSVDGCSSFFDPDGFFDVPEHRTQTEHRKDVDNTKKEKYTRSGKKRLMSTINKSVLTDHATTENHIIDWEGVNIVDKEPNRRIRHTKEAIWIRKLEHPSTETRAIMNCLTCTMTSSSVIGTDEINVTR